MLAFPSRYEPVRRLGSGGGGEVWAVRDRVSDRALAFKVLAAGAGEPELAALVREVMALSGLEGLGLPRVVGFGALADGRRYMVRELVEGESLDQVIRGGSATPWIEPLACACDQLTILHRAGLLHGDLKPANVIVGGDGRGTLVDLGLSARWRDGGARVHGLTPRYAAPEVLRGEPLTVRGEVYALGIAIADALKARGAELEPAVAEQLAAVAARASAQDPLKRFPSVDELANALRRIDARAKGREASATIGGAGLGGEEPAWPVVGIDATSQELLELTLALPAGGVLALDGPEGSGRTTLARRLAWTLGIKGEAVVVLEPTGADDRLVDEEPSAIVVADDAAKLGAGGWARLRAARERGGRLVAVGERRAIAAALAIPESAIRTFTPPPLDARLASDLVARAMPSLPEALREHVVARAGGRPGELRAIVRKLAARAFVSPEEVDDALDPGAARAGHVDRAARLAEAERALDRGRLDDVDRQLDALSAPRDDEERVRMALARAKGALGRANVAEAERWLEEIAPLARTGKHARAWDVAWARVCLRAGRYAEAVSAAERAISSQDEDALTADALAVEGVARALMGDDERSRDRLDRAVTLAKASGDPRACAIAFGSSAIGHQRAGRMAEARRAYETSLAAAERAEDAVTVATTRLNLAGLAQAEGDLAAALAHLEAAVDMGRRAGGRLTVQQALLNLANLDLFLGRYARATNSIAALRAEGDALSPGARAQLLGLEAELTARVAERAPENGAGLAKAAELHEKTASAYEALGRPLDAAEASLEGLLVRSRLEGVDAASLERQLAAVRERLGGAGDAEGFGEHGALAALVRGTIARLRGDEEGARKAFDDALLRAEETGRREWAWRALEARARLSASQGSIALARRDTEAALAMLEETAAKLPRDLREVFWDDSRRRALRAALLATPPSSAHAWISPPRSAISSMSPSVLGARLAEDRLARILEINRELSREHDMGRLLGKVIDHAIALLGAERGCVVLLGEQGELEVYTARERLTEGALAAEPHARFSRSVAARVVASGEPVVTVSAKDDDRLRDAVSVHQLPIQSIACVPIRGAPPVGAPIGALYVETRLRPGLRFYEELPSLSAFADQAAIAIENARLLGENRARAEQLSRANEELAAAKERLASLLGRRTEQLAEARRGLRQARAELRNHFGYAGLVGTSAAMRKLYALIERVKDTDVPVLITGESGTGKEMVARAVHTAGVRAKKPFLGVNCGAIPANLLESELFGHVRGAFTGADRDRKGLVREADGGTLLLDEIGEMPQKMQAGLLRVLQERCVRPVGGTTEERVDVRIIAATHRDLARLVREGSFREDLYYRLHVVELRVPPLRERIEDIPPLIDHFLALFAARYRRERKTVSREALRRLCAYSWPGNVRQLEHVLLSAWLMGEHEEITVDDLELPVSGGPPSAARPGRSGDRRPVTPSGAHASTRAEFKASERERILSALSACNWNRVQAAKMIGVPRRTFYRRLKEFGIL